MHDPFEAEKRPFITHLRRLRRRVWLSLLWERATAAFWRFDCWLLFFAGLWLLGLPAVFGTPGNALALILFLGGFLYFLYQGMNAFHWPDSHAVDRRLEQYNRLAHRPLERIGDKLANPQKEATRSLWQAGRNAAFALIMKLRAPLPRPVLAVKDPFALRIFVLLVLAAGIVTAGSQWRERIAFGLFPFSVHWQDQVSDNIVVWITPPEYTHMPQVTLRGSGSVKDAVNIAQGSVIKARVRNGIGRPVLMLDDRKIPMKPLDSKSWGIETVAMPAQTMKIVQFFLSRAAIPLHYIQDTPPQIALKGAPVILPKGTLQIPLAIKDDYGVTDLTMHMTLDPAAGSLPLGQPVEDVRAVMSGPNADTELKPIYDMTWHPWAGMSVIISLEAKDALGQTAAVEPLHMTLPERAFLDPVARQLADIRKKMIREPVDSSPEAAAALEKLLMNPDLYRGDIIVFLSLRSMASRLHYAPGTMTTALAIIPQLWDTALRIEDGNLTLAARNLRDAKTALENLLKNPDATDEQIAAAMDDLRMAMGAYLQEVVREIQKRMAAGNMGQQALSPQLMARSLDGEALAAFLDQMQAEAQRGSRDNARQMLSKLQQLMDSLDPSAMSGEIPPQLQALAEGISALQKLIEWQRELLDRTQQHAAEMKESGAPVYPDFLPPEENLFEKWGEGAMPPAPQETPRDVKQPPRKVSTQIDKTEQERLRFLLGDIMRDAGEKLGDIPGNLQVAETDMRSSSGNLGENRPDLSAPHQEEALKNLEQSMEQMNQQMQAMMKNMVMLSFGMSQLDPLGRPMGQNEGQGMFPGSRVKIPDEAERKRALDILKTLRKRAGELQRPDYELDYYRRLMRQF